MKTTPALLGTLLLAALLPRPSACADGFPITPLRLSPRTAVFYGGPWDNAIVAVATPKGIVVIDAPFSVSIARTFRDAVQAEFRRGDFACLVNTHEHRCHVGGNAAFADIPIIGHESLRREMLRDAADPNRVSATLSLADRQIDATRAYFQKNDPGRIGDGTFAGIERAWRMIQADYRKDPAIVPPTITFDRDLTLHLGDVTLRLLYYGCTHGIADTIVSIPEENLVLTGGIIEPGKVPMLDKAAMGAATAETVERWFAVMHGILDAADANTRFLPAHGRTILHKEQCAAFISYVEHLWSAVRKEKDAGKTPGQARVALPLAAFPEAAGLHNESLPGSEWEVPDIHGQNLDLLRALLERH